MKSTRTSGEPEAETLSANHRFLLSLVMKEFARNPGYRVLDYGSGYGEVVFALRRLEVDAYGADTFYNGEEQEALAAVRALDPDSRIVRLIVAGRLPFPDNYFDLVLSNQVFEHVVDLRQALKELQRVTKPGGKMVSLFPTLDVLVEWHLRLPLVHWIPRRSRLRRWFAWLLRAAGLGVDFWGESFDEWFLKAFGFLDRSVFYRKSREVMDDYRPFFTISHIEDQWLQFRVPHIRSLLRIPGVDRVVRLLVRQVSGMVILSNRKKCEADARQH